MKAGVLSRLQEYRSPKVRLPSRNRHGMATVCALWFDVGRFRYTRTAFVEASTTPAALLMIISKACDTQTVAKQIKLIPSLSAAHAAQYRSPPWRTIFAYIAQRFDADHVRCWNSNDFLSILI